jgi:acid phosphatase type 7
VLAGLFLAAALAGCRESGFVVAPYLQNPGRTEMTVLWTAPQTDRMELRYGQGDALDRRVTAVPARTSNGPAAQPLISVVATPALPGSNCLYKARLTGLTPGTRYRYQVATGTGKAGGEFRTFPDGREPFTFAAYGDTRTGIAAHRQVALAMAAQHPDFILHTGDLTDGGAGPLYLSQFFAPLAGVIDHIPLCPERGNHEGDGVAYKAFFPLPGSSRWYSFDCANAHFVGLDSTAGKSNAPEMLEWLDRDLAASKAEWKIVFCHHPSYDAGRHHTEWGRDSFVPVFRRHKVDLVIAGHSHGYQRTVPLCTPGENEDAPITYLVAAGGGAPLSAIDNSPVLAASARQYHFVLIRIEGETLSGRAIGTDGALLDSFKIAKPGGKHEPAYLAQAVPERDFDEIREAILRCLRAAALPSLPAPGRPVTAGFPLGAGRFAMKFKLFLDNDGDYTMEPFRGTSPANGTADVTVTIAAKDSATVEAGVLRPGARFECHYEIEGRKGVVLGDPLRCQPPSSGQPVDSGGAGSPP